MGVTNPLPCRGPYMNEFIVVLDGTNQELVPAQGAQRYFLVSNEAGNSDIFLNITGGDATNNGFTVPAGTRFVLENGCDNQINVSGAVGDNVYAVASNY